MHLEGFLRRGFKYLLVQGGLHKNGEKETWVKCWNALRGAVSPGLSHKDEEALEVSKMVVWTARGQKASSVDQRDDVQKQINLEAPNFILIVDFITTLVCGSMKSQQVS